MANNWQEDELLLTLHLYCCTPFGKLHQTNPEIVKLASIIARTPSAVAMKACNFASLDPALSQKGLQGASKADRALWNSFMSDSTVIAEKAQELYETKVEQQPSVIELNNTSIIFPTGATESLREVKVRRVQRFFRQAVLQSYDNRCAISGLAIPQLLVASHIIPWAKDESRRADPTNGILLNALYDKAFDCGLITVDEGFRLVLSDVIRLRNKEKSIKSNFIDMEGTRLSFPVRFRPDLSAIRFHNENIFLHESHV